MVQCRETATVNLTLEAVSIETQTLRDRLKVGCDALNVVMLVRAQLPQLRHRRSMAAAADSRTRSYGFGLTGLIVQQEDTGVASRRSGCNSR